MRGRPILPVPSGIPKTWRRFFRIKSGHLVDSQPVCGCFTESRAVARPVSYEHCGEGRCFFANERLRRRAQHGSALGPTDIELHETLSIFASRLCLLSCAMRYAQGCSLLLEGAQRAASKMLRRTSCGTGLSAKARGLQRSRISSWTIGIIAWCRFLHEFDPLACSLV